VASADVLERRHRRRARRKLALEAVAVLGVTAVAVGAVYLFTSKKVASPWRVAGTHVWNVSHAPGLQTEVSVAVDRADPRVLVAASNDSIDPAIRIYVSGDGGATWKSERGPLLNRDTCAWGDPAVAVAPNGRQYVAYTEKSVCSSGPDLTPYLVVASRPGSGSPWLMRRVTRPAVKFGFDDKPAIAVAADGRVYVAWSRLIGAAYQTTVLSSSADGGRTWSRPRPVDRRLVQPQLVSLAAGRAGSLYVAGVDASRGVWVARSTDGGHSFAVKQAAPLPGNRARTCIVFGKFVIPQQAVRCLGPDPTVTTAGARVYVTYATVGANGTQDVATAVFDPSLRSLGRDVVGPVEKKKADQFWPAAAVDRRTGDLWACYYDTTGDADRKSAWFTCAVSRDGLHWSKPVRAGAHAASPEVLWADAEIYGFGDAGGWGGYAGLAVEDGVAHPLWIDTRNLEANGEEILAARVSGRALGR
jgi:hypothetical protein